MSRAVWRESALIFPRQKRIVENSMHRIVIILTRPSSTGPNLNVLSDGNGEMWFPFRRGYPVFKVDAVWSLSHYKDS